MRIRAAAPGSPRTWEVVAPPGTTVGALAAAVGLPRAARYALGGRAVEAAWALADAGVRDGSLLAPLAADAPPPPAAVALVAASGPHAGTVWPLAPWRRTIGRHPSVDVLLDDPEVAGLHAELCVGPDGSCTVRPRAGAPTALAGRPLVHAAPLDPGVVLEVGGTVLRLEDVARGAPPRPDGPGGPGDVLVRHRPPRRLPPPPPPPPAAPAPAAPPAPAATARGLLSMLVPSATGAAFVAALRPSMAPLAAVAPAGATASWLVLAGLDARARATARRGEAAAAVAHEAACAAHAEELRARLVARHPDPGELACRIRGGDVRLWERRRTHDDFLALAPGTHDGVPVELDLRAPAGVVGPRERALDVARALLVQLVAHHGPADCGVEVWTDDPLAWAWTAWLPHRGARAACRVVVVDEGPGTPTRRAAWRDLLAAGGTALVVARRRTHLPEECATVVALDARASSVTAGAGGAPRPLSRAWTVPRARAEELAAALAPWRDPDEPGAGAVTPLRVEPLALLGAATPDVEHVASVVAARWAQARDGGGLVAPLGATADGTFTVDYVRDGPHALVAGTTGSGKSELLRALVACTAASADAARVAFVLVDYKGGSAFDGLAALPHVVDVVTDLDLMTARRAIAGLEGEIRRREHLLRALGVADIADLPRTCTEPLPRLVVVVDEFATLAQDLPAFVDALVDVAQRGRSLGVHLVLATQRPSGAVKDSIRTNTNLRIALRVVDGADSRDVIGSDAAASIDPDARGRAFARTGPGALVALQCAHLGATVARPADGLRLLPVGPTGAAPVGDEGELDAPRALDVLVRAVQLAHRRSGCPRPRRPWTEPLPDRLPLADLLDRAPDGPEWTVPFARADDPHDPVPAVVRWRPAGGNLLVTGLPGSGTTTALRAVVDAAIAGAPRTPDVYVLTTAPAAWHERRAHPSVGAVVGIDDHERTRRLLRMLGARLEARRDGSPAEGARPALVVVDGAGALRLEHDTLGGLDVLDALERLAAEGPAAGVHLAFADVHAGALGHRLERTVAHRVLLRTDDRAHAALVPRDVDLAALPAGRGVDVPTGCLVQIGLPAEPPAAREHDHVAPDVGVLPTRVAAGAIEAARVESGVLHLPLGIDDHDLAACVLPLAAHDHLLVTGPARCGRTSLLDALAQVASRAGVAVVRLGTNRRAPASVLHDRNDIVAALDALDGGRSALVLVDDADQVDDAGAVERLLASHGDVVHVVAAVRNDRVRGLFRHWVDEIRRQGTAVLLRADDADGDLVGVRLPRDPGPRVAGRGWLVRDGQARRVQFACGGEDPSR